MLTFLGWIDGTTAAGVVVFGFIFGLFFLYNARKSEAKVLYVLALSNIFAGLMFLGVFLDFIIVLLTGANINNSNGLVGILSYIWLAPAICTAIYIGADLLVQKYKWYILALFIILSVVFEVLIFIDPFSAFNFNDPTTPGENLIDYNLVIFSAPGLLMAGFLLIIILLLGVGFLIKAVQTSGIIRRNFAFLSIGSLCFCVFGLLEGLTAPGVSIIFIRIGYLSSFWFMYYGLKA